jgi:hypothetical protein
MNRIAENTKAPVPEVGMGATEYCYTDRNAWTVVWVSPNKKTIILTRDSYKRIDSNGMSESQEYEFTSDMNPENGRKATLRKNGQWRWQGDQGTDIFCSSHGSYGTYG